MTELKNAVLGATHGELTELAEHIIDYFQLSHKTETGEPIATEAELTHVIHTWAFVGKE